MRTKRILVVDDDPDIRQVLLDRMSSFGYVVETAVDGREALDALRRGGFDGMLVGMLMAGGGGLGGVRGAPGSHPCPPGGVGPGPAGERQTAPAGAGGARAFPLQASDAS